MSDQDFSITGDQEIMSMAVNYNNMLYELISPYLSGSILEVGSGVGNFTGRLLENSEIDSITCFEIDKSCCERFKQQLSSSKNWTKVTFHEYDFNRSNLKKHFDFAFSFNVLEHIEDDSAALRKIITYLKPGGHLVLYLPAMNCVYGSIDRELLHYRRYDKEMIEKLLNGLPIEYVKMRYCNMIGAIGWFYTNRILKSKSQTQGKVVFYDKYILPISRVIEQYLPNLFGLNLYILIKKE